MVKVFKVWRNKEALKMECNKRNRNIRYAIFRYSNLKKLSEYLVLQSNIFQYFCDRFSKLKRFFSVFESIIFYIFGRFVTKFLARNVPFFENGSGRTSIFKHSWNLYADSWTYCSIYGTTPSKSLKTICCWPLLNSYTYALEKLPSQQPS